MKKKLVSIAMAAAVVFAANSVFANILGDVDGDSKITANDASVALDYSLNDDKIPGDDVRNAADVDGDGKIMANDASLILQKSLNEDYVFPKDEGNGDDGSVLEGDISVGLVKGNNDNVILGLYASEDMPAKVETAGEDEGKTYVQGTTNPTIGGDGIPTGGAYLRYTAPASGVLTLRIKTTNNKVTKFVFADGTQAADDISNYSGASVFDTVSINMNEGQSVYVYATGSKTSLFAISFATGEHIETTTREITTKETTTETTTARKETTEVTTKAVNGDKDTSDGIVVSNFSQLKDAISNGEKVIYIQGTIDCTERLYLSESNANVTFYGLTNADDTAAVLDFASFRSTQRTNGESSTGIVIKGSHYDFRNLIVQNAPDCGVRIKGSGAGYCTFENCVFRYNQNSGVSVTAGGCYNTFRSCDSYRNGDIVWKCGDDADGFSVKLGAGDGNNFYNCRVWDNSDDGWDSYDSSANDLTPYCSYIECLAWNNGNPNVFTGEYDYENNRPLDKNLLYVQAILEKYPDFEEQYNAHTVTEWPQVTISLLGKTRTYAQLHSSLWGGNPNGFKFGSANTSSKCYRYVKNCIAFDHVENIHQSPAKGYDQNSGAAQYDLVNALSFNNGQNYWMDKMTLLSVQGTVWGFGTLTTEDAPSTGLDIVTPSEEKQEEIKAIVYAYRDGIYSLLDNDKIPGERLCNVFDN
jgi:hypothetical protein